MSANLKMLLLPITWTLWVPDMQDVDTSDMQRKLEAYNHVLDQEMATLGRADINRRQQFLTHCKLNVFLTAIVPSERLSHF